MRILHKHLFVYINSDSNCKLINKETFFLQWSDIIKIWKCGPLSERDIIGKFWIDHEVFVVICFHEYPAECHASKLYSMISARLRMVIPNRLAVGHLHDLLVTRGSSWLASSIIIFSNNRFVLMWPTLQNTSGSRHRGWYQSKFLFTLSHIYTFDQDRFSDVLQDQVTIRLIT